MVIFQQLLANKHYRLRDSKFGRAEIWFSSPTWQKKKKIIINPVQSKNRARPMAARLKKNKPRAEQEPRSAHGRAVKKNKNRGAVVTALEKKRGYLGPVYKERGLP